MNSAATASRESMIAGFLAGAGWHSAERSLLAGDASFRRYDRLVRDGQTAVLMDAPPPMERVGPFITIARKLRDREFSAPAILAADEGMGLLLIEDLGDDTYSRLLEQGEDERRLYELATDVLVEIRRRMNDADLRELPAFDVERCLREVRLLLDWYWPTHFGAPAAGNASHAFEAAWRQVLPRMFDAGRTMALFDYHIDNLLLLRSRDGFRACGLLDFQDAVHGPAPFDLASLLEDVRREVPRDLVEDMIRRYLAGVPGADEAKFRAAYAVSAAQRNTRIVGTFARLLKRDGKPHYQRFMPRVWQLLENDLGHPALEPVAAWFEHFLPAGDRVAIKVAP